MRSLYLHKARSALYILRRNKYLGMYIQNRILVQACFRTVARGHAFTVGFDGEPASVRILQKEEGGALYRSHGSGRLLTQSTIVVF
jgi:hypothetical protein